MFDKFELGIIERSLKRTIDSMRESEFVDEQDRHLLKCEALLAKVVAVKKELV